MILKQMLFVFVNTIYFLVVAMQFMMFARAIMSWIVMDEETPVTRFLNAVTDPVIVPVRMLLEKVEPIRNLPIDLSFFVSFLLLVILQNILPPVII